ncbi:MAG: RNA polymerase subunit alpha domain protein [Planctomycetota bacterium]|nr:MAG: RNA polymerase subunit alpha domain protein [Planctomycetota bacterium]
MVSTPVRFDTRDLVTGTGPFGPSEIRHLLGCLGSDASTHRDLRLAVKELESSGERSPASSVRLGVCHYLLGSSQDAIETLRMSDGSAMALYYQGLSHAALCEYEKAEEAFKAAQRAGYDATACTVAIAEALRSNGRLEDARIAIETIGEAKNASADYWALKGSLHAESGMPVVETAELLEKALSIDPGHPAALFALGVINDRIGNDSEAQSCYERSLERYPTSIGALLNLGLLYEDKDDFVHAQKCYKRILAAFPDHLRARLFLKDSSASGDLQIGEQDQKQRDRIDQVLMLPVTDFELSVRSRNCLQKMGIVTLGDLARISEQEILESKNFGETSLVEIKEMLASKGITLGQFAAPAAVAEPEPEPVEPSADEQEIYSLPLTELNLSVRARKCTTKLGIHTIGDLVRRTGDDLMECKNFGVTSLNEVREKLTERNLKLRGD